MSDTRPIFVVGVQRSGTTLLQSLLGAHPAIAAPPELHYWFRVQLRSLAWDGDLTDDDVLARAVHTALNPPVALLAEAGFDEAAVLARAAAGPRTHAGVVEAIMRDAADRQGARRWSEKSPGQPAGVALGWFPDAQLVHIVRDPRDTVASSVRAPWGEHDPWVLAHRWRRFTRDTLRVGARVGPGSYLRVRYEDLVADPVATMRVVFAFLDEAFDPAILDDPDLRRPTLAPVAAPHQRLDEPVAPRPDPVPAPRLQRARVGAAAHGLLAGLGYPVPSLAARSVGHLANAVLAPASWDAARWWWRGRRARHDPRRLESVLDQFEQRAATGL